MNLSFAYTHSLIDFYFKQSPRDFVVTEIPLYSFNGEGAHLILKLRKKDLTTFEMLKIIASFFGVKEKDIGYAGLKDKNALAIQYISLPLHLAKHKVESFFHTHIKILEITQHNNKIKIGHLKGNNFFIRLKKVTPLNALKISQVLESMENFGIPNYFSYQRFGIDGRNYIEGKEIVEGKRKIRDKKIQNFLVSAYQSYLFNLWLSMRINLSHIIQSVDSNMLYKSLQEFLKIREIPQEFKRIDFCKILKNQTHFLKLFYGDIMCHYPYGKNFTLDNGSDLVVESKRFLEKNIAITGLLSGVKMSNASSVAGFFENLFLDKNIKSVGQRRYAWIYPQAIKFNYKEEEAQGEISFFLPKGAYATNLLRELAHCEIMDSLDA